MKITYEMLTELGACEKSLTKFFYTFPDGVEVRGKYLTLFDKDLFDDAAWLASEIALPGVKEIRVDGTSAKLIMDEHGHLLSKTAPSGYTWTSERDEHGLLSRTAPSGYTLTYKRDEHGRLLSGTDPYGGTWTYERNDQGRVVSETAPSGDTCIYVRDEHGRVISQTAQSGYTLTYVRDEHGHVVSRTDPDGHIATYDTTYANPTLKWSDEP